ncbi:hypothetical protein HanRHA438_Chr15g0691931 [Helianthus annuus]|nr:hypothetical protein HanRHA438_Chr15g0691931 [Helianthus annuus]
MSLFSSMMRKSKVAWFLLCTSFFLIKIQSHRHQTLQPTGVRFRNHQHQTSAESRFKRLVLCNQVDMFC